jgi:protein-S-isoprenylcysteine O-methyltransferase Ste14
MVIFASSLGFIWLALIIVWVVTALSAKRTVKRGWYGVWWRLAIIAIVIAMVHYNGIHAASYITAVDPIVALNVLGLLLAALGIALAIWARLYLGRNWGMPMSVKENPELVTTGPYAYIRHPIYAGILLALLGSSLIVWWWSAIFIWSLIYFLVFAARGEEKLMRNTFPTTYPQYQARTKRLIPFVY